jgi:hypothetical protein
VSGERDLAGQAQDLEDALKRSRWFDGSRLQVALYEWAESGLPLDDVRNWLAAGLAHADDVLALRDLGVSADLIHDAGLGEQISAGALSVEDAAERVLGSLPAGGLDGVRDAADAARLADETASWAVRVQRLAGLLDDQAIPPELLAWARGCHRDDLLDAQEEAAVWAGPLTMEVARRELRRLDGLPARWELRGSLWPRAARGGPTASYPLRALILGSLATGELTHRLGMRLEAAIADPPAYLTAALGPYPSGEAAQLLWTQAALDVEAFRVEYAITDPEQALGDPGASMLRDQRQRFRELNRAVTWIRVQLEQNDVQLEGGVAWAPTEGAAANALRPDQRLTRHLLELAPTLPAAARAATAALSDGDLAAAWRSAMIHDLGRDVGELGGDADAVTQQAAECIQELERRVQARVQASIADPPAFILDALGPWPREYEVAAGWEAMAAAIEEYRLVTETSDPIHALGATEAATNAWQQCWRRELLQDVTQTRFVRVAYHHLVFGSKAEHAELVDVLSSTADPWLGVRPDAAMLEQSATLATDELRYRVSVARPLLAQRPPNRTGELGDIRLRYAKLRDWQRDAERSLAAAQANRTRLRWAIGLGARAARAAAADAVGRCQDTLNHLQLCMTGVWSQVRELERAQAAYFDWWSERALPVAQGQAAAQALQAREASLLDDLAGYPPAYLLAELGPPTVNRDGRAAWQRGAQALERYRATYHVCDQDRTVGKESTVGSGTTPKELQDDRDRLGDALQEARRAVTDSLARELDRGVSLSGLDDGPSGLAIEP